jgi:hypothetical protein
VDHFRHYRHLWAVDFEFHAPAGERPQPLCLVARELRTDRYERLWLASGAPTSPPYDVDEESLFIAYYASAELGCHLALGWPIPLRILDLYAEFCRLTSGLAVPCGRGVLGALTYFGLGGIDAAEKKEMRDLAIRGVPFTEAEQEALTTYCQSDVDALAQLLPAMASTIDLPRALLRGRYTAAAARIEWNGTQLDTAVLTRLRKSWPAIKARLVAEVNRDYQVFVPAGQRTIDPQSRYGAAILETAREWSVDPHQLADAAAILRQEERKSKLELFEARRAARKLLGMSHRQINLFEDAGHDSADWPELDLKSRELARLYPALGIGSGYTSEGGEDQTDYSGQLWGLLRERDERTPPRHDPGLLRRAAELVLELSVNGDAPLCPMRFSSERWAEYLIRKNIPWPRLETGALALDDETFREMARAYPAEVGPIRELRHTLSQLRLNELAVGSDGRNRCLLSMFGTKTGRNAPSNSKFIFGPSTWLRSLIRPAPGRAVAYVDWSQQELAIAAALSGDHAMQEAYKSGDFYLTFAKMAGAVPAHATKQSHAAQREQFKTVALGVLYGLSAEGLARKLDVPPCCGRELLRAHQETFRRFWSWSDRIEMAAMLHGKLQTVFGWTVHVGPDANPRSLRNFPMQGSGSEMMRLACCLTTERGIQVCAVVHDALMVEGGTEEIEAVVAETERAMREASELVIPGFPLRTEAKIIRHPDHYADERGSKLWETICHFLAECADSTEWFGETR